jgi:hypothetical protein
LHPLQHAGLSRRTVINRQLTFPDLMRVAGGFR